MSVEILQQTHYVPVQVESTVAASRTNFKDILNQKFNRLAVIERMPNSHKGRSQWKCKCDCGNETIVGGVELRNGNTKSCGCLGKELTVLRSRKEPYQWLWTIIQHNIENSDKISTLTFKEFLTFTTINQCHYCGSPIEWLKYSSKKCSAYYLDRKDNLQGYSKENCVVCCSICNRVKSNQFSYKEMVKLGRLISEIKSERIS